MNEIFIEQHQLVLDDGSEMRLRYYVTEEMIKNSGNLYGIGVKLLGAHMESEYTGPISESVNWVSNLCRKIASGLVTPIGLIDVVDDFITGSLR